MGLFAVFFVMHLEGTPLSQPPVGLYEKIATHCKTLSKGPEPVAARHQEAQKKLVESILANYQPGRELPIVLICTGNSRRSMMGAAMGNGAAAFLQLPDIRFYSGGTDPSAFNSRSIRALREIGFEIEPNGKQAPKGAKGELNPVYLVRWGAGKPCQSVEFSKHYGDGSNPRKDFIALMVCDEADGACPLVMGSSQRISLPFADPKSFDGTPQEEAKYAERRDDLGRFMLSTLTMVREQSKEAGK